ncbi:MAG: Putative cytochrome P450 hydroxylase, partial [uncultured Craurococcus sp.]
DQPRPHPPRGAGLRPRPLLPRLFRRSLSAHGGAARGGARGPPPALRLLGRRPPRRGARGALRLGELLLQPRRRPRRFRPRDALAAAQHDPRGRSARAHPRPRHPRPRPLARRDEGPARALRRRCRPPGDRACGARRDRRHRRPGRGLSALRLSGCSRHAAGGARACPALCRRRLQRLRPRQCAAARGVGKLRPAPLLGRRCLQAGKAGAWRLRRADPCRRRCRRDHPHGGGAADPLALLRRARHHGERHRRRALLPRPLPRPVCPAARRPRPRPRRLRGGGALRESGADLLPHHRPPRPPRRHRAGGGREGADVPRLRQPRPAQVGAAGRVRHHPPRQRPCRLRQWRAHVRRPAPRPAGGRGDPPGPGPPGHRHRDHRHAGAAPQQHPARAGAAAAAPARRGGM